MHTGHIGCKDISDADIRALLNGLQCVDPESPPPPENIKSNVVEKPVARELVPCLHA